MKKTRRPSGRKSQRLDGPEAVELCEEAVHLLRRAPVSAFALYYLGSLPFWLGFLYFWSDMSRDPFAAGRSVQASLAVALLFLWMKCLHVLSVDRLRSRISADEPRTGSHPGLPQLVASQAFLQGTAAFVVPMAILVTIPLGFVLAYYQNTTVLGAADRINSLRDLHKRAARQCAVWPAQNHSLLLLLFLFSCAVALNLGAAVVFLPQLLRMVTGTETVFTVSGFGMVNSTLLLIILALTHLCVDPLTKAVYLLRCFYGESLETGEDLRAELSSLNLRKTARASVLALIVAGFLFNNLPAGAVAAGTQPSTSARVQNGPLSPAELERALTEVIERREFRWRLPREMAPKIKEEKGWFASFVDDVMEVVKQNFREFREALERGLEWLWDALFGKAKTSSSGGASSGGLNLFDSLRGLLLFLGVFVVGVLAVWLFRALKGRQPVAEVAESMPIVTVPDVSRDDVTADQLPEDGWISLARELMEQGDLRLAMRALYLACLATLARRGVLSIARFKSNMDYEREVRRRSHAQPDLVTAFSRNVAVFDRSWYGMHEVTPDVITDFTANLKALQGGPHEK